jgi:hypothetical protein
MRKLLLFGFILMSALMGYVSYLAHEYDNMARDLYGFLAVLFVICFLVLLFLNDEK